MTPERMADMAEATYKVLDSMREMMSSMLEAQRSIVNLAGMTLEATHNIQAQLNDMALRMPLTEPTWPGQE